MKQQIMRIVALLGSGMLFGWGVVLLLLYTYSSPQLPSPKEALLSPKTVRELHAEINWKERGGEAKPLTPEEYEALYAKLQASTALKEAPPLFQVGATLTLKQKDSLQTIEIDQGGAIWRVEKWGAGWLYFSGRSLK